jgi:hypothetical protein
MRDLNPTARGFAIIVLIAVVVTALSLQPALGLIILILQVLFLIAIALALYRLWRSRRSEISMWPLRSRVAFYGAAALAALDVAARFFSSWPTGGFEALVFFIVLGLCGFAMWRVWHDEHTYGY